LLDAGANPATSTIDGGDIDSTARVITQQQPDRRLP
jgi:hypothetical protein